MRVETSYGILRAGLALSTVAASLCVWVGAGHATDWVAREGVKLRLVSSATALNGATKSTIGLDIDLDPGWQFYGRDPGEYAFPPKFDWSGSENVRGATIVWPAPTRYVFSTRPPVTTLGYKGEVLLPIVLQTASADEPAAVRLSLDYAVCNEYCIQDKVALALTLRSGPGEITADAKRIENWLVRAAKNAGR